MYGYGYGYNNYGYGSPSFGFGAAGGIFATLLAIGFIAAIVLAVVVYRKYASDGNEQPLSLKDKSTWGPFLRFDKLVIDKILRALYIFCAIFTAFFFLALVLASLADGIAVFLITLIMCAILCLIIELLERVSFESVMLSVIITHNTSDIKGMLERRPTTELPPAGPAPEPPFQPGPVAPVEPDSESPVAPVEPEQPQTPATQQAPAPAPEATSPEQTAPATGGFCPMCGAPIQPGSHFCPECGKKLD